MRGKKRNSPNSPGSSARNVIVAFGCIALLGWLAYQWLQSDKKEDCRITTAIDLSDEHPKNPFAKGLSSDRSRRDSNANTSSALSPSPPAPLPEDGARGAEVKEAPRAADGTRRTKINDALSASLDEMESQSIDLQLGEIRNRIEQLQLPYFNGVPDPNE